MGDSGGNATLTGKLASYWVKVNKFILGTFFLLKLSNSFSERAFTICLALSGRKLKQIKLSPSFKKFLVILTGSKNSSVMFLL